MLERFVRSMINAVGKLIESVSVGGHCIGSVSSARSGRQCIGDTVIDDTSRSFCDYHLCSNSGPVALTFLRRTFTLYLRPTRTAMCTHGRKTVSGMFPFFNQLAVIRFIYEQV